MATPATSDPRTALRSGLPDRYLTPEDLVELLGIPSVETLYTWRKKSLGPPAFRVGRHLRWDPAVVQAWVAQQSARDAA
ncbi:helix-turn-helix domain-containing protein [Streptomyces sp. RKAG293]|uniref:helix-turn-helix transcriptional regulator n=1 Tax=Streptomyces sp. RKAG293 TaxID=2893403 RepID=UPI0020332C39|nr:helix-turn-helix domain-containing protein [Streptomyces sp. RKAG293]MCM2419008.1 helix-turn-helix domain-containing protein [Streptomyces sp. RKAG293]